MHTHSYDTTQGRQLLFTLSIYAGANMPKHQGSASDSQGPGTARVARSRSRPPSGPSAGNAERADRHGVAAAGERGEAAELLLPPTTATLCPEGPVNDKSSAWEYTSRPLRGDQWNYMLYYVLRPGMPSTASLAVMVCHQVQHEPLPQNNVQRCCPAASQPVMSGMRSQASAQLDMCVRDHASACVAP